MIDTRPAVVPRRWREREIIGVLGLALLVVLLGRVPGFDLLFYPFRLFGTFVHELCHGLAALATGGAFRRFVVNPDLSGHAISAGGVGWIIASAGYVGSAMFGGLLVLLSARGVGARRVVLLLGVALGLLCVLFVRNLFGIATGVGLAAALFLAGQRLPPRWADAVLLFLAVQMMVASLDSLLDLLQLSGSRVLTDAQIMANATGIPAVLWALLWSALAVLLLVASLWAAYRDGRRKF